MKIYKLLHILTFKTPNLELHYIFYNNWYKNKTIII
jgi:hypothetical protein